jgi:hypothetical protein
MQAAGIRQYVFGETSQPEIESTSTKREADWRPIFENGKPHQSLSVQNRKIGSD